MRTAFALSVALVFLLLAAQVSAGDRFEWPEGLRSQYVPGEVLVKYRPVGEAAVASSLSRSRTTVKRRYKGIDVHHLKLPATGNVEEAVREFALDPAVEYAEPNYLRYTAATMPNDLFFPRLWGLYNTGQVVNGTSGTAGGDVDAPVAWGITTGNSAVVVAVIDSGVDYNHPDLAGNISPGLRYDFVHSDDDPMDSNGHGTHVAGTIAAVGNNGVGIAGVAWTATLMPLRAGNALGLLSVSSIVSAIDYAVANGAKVINASYGGGNYSNSEYSALASARQAGVLFVAAAGNEAGNNDSTPAYPASYNLDNIIAVAATDQHDNLVSFSNYGTVSVDVAAPGVNIYSTRPARQTLWSDDFDAGNLAGWTTGGSKDTWGPTPVLRYSGIYSLAVNPGGNYDNEMNAWTQAPPLDLAAVRGSKLSFMLTGQSQSNSDFLYVETSTDGAAWIKPTVFLTNSSGAYVGSYANGISGDRLSQWYRATVDLGNLDGQGTVHIRFRFASDSSTNYAGWFIDDIAVTAASTDYSGAETDYYRYMSGTSMATPHVAGLAALVWGFKPDLTYLQVKDIILNSVDPRPSLAGKTLTGGRINALAALYHVTPQPPNSLAASLSPSQAIDLAWSDGSLNESGFQIERKSGSGAYALIGTTAKDTLTYSDTEPSAGTYCYRIAAFNAGGGSTYSNEACATTTGAIVTGEPAAGGGGGGGGGGCFIATAAFGSPLAGQVGTLREFRDRYLLKSSAGQWFVGRYYRISPAIAAVISRSDLLRTAVRWSLLPVVGGALLLVRYGPEATAVVLLLLVLFILAVFKSGRLYRQKRNMRSPLPV